MSKNTNDVLTRFGTGCFIAVPIWHSGHQRVNVGKLQVRFAVAEFSTN